MGKTRLVPLNRVEVQHRDYFLNPSHLFVWLAGLRLFHPSHPDHTAHVHLLVSYQTFALVPFISPNNDPNLARHWNRWPGVGHLSSVGNAQWLSWREEVVLLRLHVFFSPGGRIHFLAQANAVLRSVYSWQSVMTTTCNVMTLALHWFRSPPGGDVREGAEATCTGCQDMGMFVWLDV